MRTESERDRSAVKPREASCEDVEIQVPLQQLCLKVVPIMGWGAEEGGG